MLTAPARTPVTDFESALTRCWSQPAEVWINKSTEEPDPLLALPLIQAACMAAKE